MKNKNILKLAAQINTNFDGHIANVLLIRGGMILTICGKGIRLTDTFDMMPEKESKQPDYSGTTC